MNVALIRTHIYNLRKEVTYLRESFHRNYPVNGEYYANYHELHQQLKDDGVFTIETFYLGGHLMVKLRLAKDWDEADNDLADLSDAYKGYDKL